MHQGKPFNPVHPGEILQEEFLKPLQLSQNTLALALRVPAPRISDIVRGKRSITADTALRLGRFFNMSPQFWMHLQSQFDLAMTQDQLGTEIEQDVQPFGEVT
jgi:addiction module HigA family antidote